MANQVALKLDLELDLSSVKKQGQELGRILERATKSHTKTSALDQLEKEIERTRNRIIKLQDDLKTTLSTEIPTKAFDSAQKKVTDLKRALSELVNTNIKKLESTGAVLGKDFTRQSVVRSTFRSTKEGAELASQLDAAKQKMQDLIKQGKAFQIDTKAVESLKDRIDAASNSLHSMVGQYKDLALQSGNSIQNALQPLVNFNTEISETIGTVSQAFGPYIQMATTAVSLLVKETQMEVAALKQMGKVAISAFKPLVSLATSAASAIKGIFSTIKKHNETTMKNLWRNLLRYGIGVRSFYFLARKIRNVIGDVINELARQIPEVNAQLSAFKTALNGLKGAIGTAFQPILSAVLPALTTLINVVSKAIAVIGKFIALLTGQNFVYAATATQVDYAKSLEKTGGAAKKAKKELEGYLSPIDEINKFQSKKDDDSGSGGGGGDFTMTKMPIEDWIKDFFDRLKRMWQQANFYDLGKMIGDKLAQMLARIPWGKIKNEARRLGKSLATLLNGIMDGEFDGKTLATYIGETLAQAINTAFEFLNQYVKHFDWKRLGEFITEMVSGFFETLDWNVITETLGELGLGLGETIAKIFEDPTIFAEAGEALGRAVNALVDMVYDFFNQQSGEDIGNAIAAFINNAIEQFDAIDFIAACNKIILTLLESLSTAIAETDWAMVGQKLAELINGIDFEGIFSSYSDLANNIIDAILDMLTNFLGNLDPQKLIEIGNSIADAINNLDFQPQRLGQIANSLIKSLIAIIKTIVYETDWDKVGEDVAAMIEEIDWAGIFWDLATIRTKLHTAVLNIIADVISSIADDIIGGVLDWSPLGTASIDGFTDGMNKRLSGNVIRNLMSKGVIEVVKQLFGIHSPSTVFKGFGDDIVQGFINGIKNIGTKARAVWESLKTTTIQIFQSMWGGIKGVINSILAGIESMANGIIRGFNGVIGTINSLSIDPPDWAKTKFGLGKLSFNIPTMHEISIPRLAQGAVIPPNKQFMAVLGDQKQGTNIETPLSTMMEAFNAALSQTGNGRTEINFLLPDRRKVAQYVLEGGRIMQTSTGKNPFELA